MPNPPIPPKTIVCVPCWPTLGDIIAARYHFDRPERRFFVRVGNDLIFHRLVEEDDHVVKAACGDLYAQAGLPRLDPVS